MASNKVGNGGNGVFCGKEETGQGRLLDFYEAETNLTWDSVESDPVTVASKHLDILETVAPKLYKQYQDRLKTIWAEIEFKSDVKLTDIKDSHHLFKPKSEDCKVLQVAIRKREIVGSEKRFLFREDLWKRMRVVDQAGLLMHEIVYEHLSKLGEEDSVKARKLNRFIFGDKSKHREFWKLIRELEVPIYP